jgi:hypothetical protein
VLPGREPVWVIIGSGERLAVRAAFTERLGRDDPQDSIGADLAGPPAANASPGGQGHQG